MGRAIKLSIVLKTTIARRPQVQLQDVEKLEFEISEIREEQKENEITLHRTVAQMMCVQALSFWNMHKGYVDLCLTQYEEETHFEDSEA